MSSNKNIKPVITLDNYEEYFLLYVDGELTGTEKKAVEDFAALHPDLKAELEALRGTRLPAEEILFGHKSDLLADSMKEQAVEESLLLYIDNELPHAAMIKMEADLKSNAGLALQYNLLLKTKSNKRETIEYPHKKELYRHTERRIAPYWLRAAAVVMLIAGSGAMVWLSSDHTQSIKPDVAVITPKTTAPTVKTPVTEPKIVPLQQEPALQTGKTNLAIHKPAIIKRTDKAIAKKATFSKPHAVIKNDVAAIELPVQKQTAAGTLAEKIMQPDVSVHAAVTSKTPPAYIPVATTNTEVPVFAVAKETGEKDGVSMKGFLRKATRFIERRTGIKAVNDDDELLIGAVALKL